MKRFNIVLIVVSILMVGVIMGYLINSKMPLPSEPVPMDSAPVPIRSMVVDRPHEALVDGLPEYRPAPVNKYYRPQAPHQVGLLKSEDEGGDLRPIYAKPVRGRRDRFHYWTTAGNGHNNYSIPLTKDGRDCTEDIGCQEIYGNETVSVWDNPEVQYKSHINRVDRFF
tara:strand:+ start:2192 stop:2695 length:504 start_codon:yes stop_codon:yes gene_type:complete